MYKKTAVMISISLSATLIFSADLSICKIEQPNSKSGMESSIQSCEAGELLLWKKLPTNFTFDLIAKHPVKYITWLLQRQDVYNDNYYDNYTYDFGAKYEDGLKRENVDYFSNLNNGLLMRPESHMLLLYF